MHDSMKKTGLFLLLFLLQPVLALSQQDTLLITADALRDGRAFVRSIVISVPGIDLVAQGHARYRLADDPAFAVRNFNDSAWQPLDSLSDISLLQGHASLSLIHISEPTRPY